MTNIILKGTNIIEHNTTRIEQPRTTLTNYYPTIDTPTTTATTRKRRRWFDTFFKHLKRGIKSKYPLCCVLDFSLNEVIHRNDIPKYYAGERRPGGKQGYVLCYIHYWLATRKHKPLSYFEECLLRGFVYFSCIGCKATLVYLQGYGPTWDACKGCGRALLFVQNSRKWRHYG